MRALSTLFPDLAGRPLGVSASLPPPATQFNKHRAHRYPVYCLHMTGVIYSRNFRVLLHCCAVLQPLKPEARGVLFRSMKATRNYNLTFVAPCAVLPFSPGSVSTTSKIICFGRVTSIMFPLK